MLLLRWSSVWVMFNYSCSFKFIFSVLQCGEIVDIRVPQVNGTIRGFAYIEFKEMVYLEGCMVFYRNWVVLSILRWYCGFCRWLCVTLKHKTIF